MTFRPGLLPAVLALASLILPPRAGADDKTKKPNKQPAQVLPGSILEGIQEQMRRQSRTPAPSDSTPLASSQSVKVRVLNYTGRSLELVAMRPNGGQQTQGLVPPAEPGSAPAIIDTYSGRSLAFKSGPLVVQTFVASNQRQQEVQIGQMPAIQDSPPKPTVPAPRAVAIADQTPPHAIVFPDQLPPPVKGEPEAGPASAETTTPPADTGPQVVEEFLRVHNEARASVGVPPLRWSDVLAGIAQEWADKLVATGTFQHRDLATAGLGENIYRGLEGHSPADAARLWLEERAAFEGRVHSQKDLGITGHMTGHYTQMVWRESTEVGYGIAWSGGRVVVVANYAPGGNRNGRRPY